MPDVHARLQAHPPARVADIGCGVGWASIGIALAYPEVQVDGYDLDPPSVGLAQANARDAGVADRVRFAIHDAADAPTTGGYDLVLACECIHDMSNVGASAAWCLGRPSVPRSASASCGAAGSAPNNCRRWRERSLLAKERRIRDCAHRMYGTCLETVEGVVQRSGWIVSQTRGINGKGQSHATSNPY